MPGLPHALDRHPLGGRGGHMAALQQIGGEDQPVLVSLPAAAGTAADYLDQAGLAEHGQGALGCPVVDLALNGQAGDAGEDPGAVRVGVGSGHHGHGLDGAAQAGPAHHVHPLIDLGAVIIGHGSPATVRA